MDINTMLVFLTFFVLIIGGIIIVQLYVLYRKRRDFEETKTRLEAMLLRKCEHAISKYRMQFQPMPKNEIGYLTGVKLSHETNMPEFYVAFGNSSFEVLGYAKFLRQDTNGHKQTFLLTSILPATAPAPYPVLSLHNELYTLDEAVSTRETIDDTLIKLFNLQVAETH